MATEPQPTSQGILQASRCLERGGTMARGPWDLPYQEIPQAPVPSNPTQRCWAAGKQALQKTYRLSGSVRQKRRDLSKSLHRGPDVQLVGIAIPTTHSLNKVVRNTHLCCNSCRTNPKAVTGERSLDASSSKNIFKPMSQQSTRKRLTIGKAKTRNQGTGHAVVGSSW